MEGNREALRERICNWDMHVEMLSRDGIRNPPRQESGGSGGKSTAVVDAVRCALPVALGTGVGTTQEESRSRTYFLATNGSVEAGTTLL